MVPSTERGKQELHLGPAGSYFLAALCNGLGTGWVSPTARSLPLRTKHQSGRPKAGAAPAQRGAQRQARFPGAPSQSCFWVFCVLLLGRTFDLERTHYKGFLKTFKNLLFFR